MRRTPNNSDENTIQARLLQRQAHEDSGENPSSEEGADLSLSLVKLFKQIGLNLHEDKNDKFSVWKLFYYIIVPFYVCMPFSMEVYKSDRFSCISSLRCREDEPRPCLFMVGHLIDR